MRRTAKAISVLLSVAAAALFSLVVYYTERLPDEFYVSRGSSLMLHSAFSITAEKHDGAALQAANMDSDGETVSLKLFGAVPIKDVRVQSVAKPVLVPGGSPFGIKMLTDGVVVIGLGEVDSGKSYTSPAREAGIKIGDILLSANGKELTGNKDIAAVVEESGGTPVEMKLKRDDKEMTITVYPRVSKTTGSYKAGIWVRDSSAGIGTVTYFDPQTGAFGGLGHPVCDVDTGELLPLMSGNVVSVNISGVTKGTGGSPGELVGSFVSRTAIGRLLANSETGLFGTLDRSPTAFSAIPMALRQEVRAGPAVMLTTITGSEPQAFDIMIESIDLNSTEKTKNMIIRVTDPDLLAKTGGIVQGMSGSPIIQNGMLVGAVTHVFVNNPAKGYGIFCENMYNFSYNLEKMAA